MLRDWIILFFGVLYMFLDVGLFLRKNTYYAIRQTIVASSMVAAIIMLIEGMDEYLISLIIFSIGLVVILSMKGIREFSTVNATK